MMDTINGIAVFLILFIIWGVGVAAFGSTIAGTLIWTVTFIGVIISLSYPAIGILILMLHILNCVSSIGG